MDISYLDNSATTAVCKQAVEKINYMLSENYGNPSSLHTVGIKAQVEMENSRKVIADLISAQPKEIIFTSGGTEANNLAIFGAVNAKKRDGKKIITTSVEHACVNEPINVLEKEGYEVIRLQADIQNSFSVEELIEKIDEETVLVSLMLVNNEVGSISKIEEAVRAIRRKKLNPLIHCDAVQAFGKIDVNVKKLGVDLLTISAHKIHGPKGIGALFIKDKVRIIPRVYGGGQEKDIRPGTQNVPFICGFASAVESLGNINENLQNVQKLKEYATNELSKLDDVIINSHENSIPYILNFSCLGIRSEVMLHHLSTFGVYVSSGSACSKGKKSHVLSALGFDNKRIDSAIRVSFSRYNTLSDVDRLVCAIKAGQEKLIRSRG